MNIFVTYNFIIGYFINNGSFDIQERGGLGFFEKSSLFPYKSEKNKMSLAKLK